MRAMTRSGTPWVRRLLGAACAALAACASPAATDDPAPRPADLLFTGGPVHTLTDAGTVSALAVRDGRIAWTGDARDADAWAGPDTRRVDLAGRALLPGFADSHIHLEGVAAQLADVDLVGTTSFAAVVERTAARAALRPAGAWILGRGWDQNDWADTAFPTHDALSAAVPDHPVLLDRIDGHALLANAAAMAAAGVDRDTTAPSGGRILRDAECAPTGVFVDDAMRLFDGLVPPPSDDLRLARLVEAVRLLNAYGLTSVHDAGTSLDAVRLFETLARRDDLTLRLHVMLRAGEPALRDPGDDLPTDDLTGQGLVKVRAIKLSADGALGSRGAALLEDYTDEPGHRGLELADRDEVLELARFAVADGWQLATHAIGDRANRVVLDAYEEALAGLPPSADPRFRVEHAQILHPDDVPRFAALGVLPSMQAQHQTSDMPWAGERLGEERLEGAYAWRSLREAGSIIPGGSDAPVEVPDPLLGLHAAVTRTDVDGHPPGGWHAEQRLTREEALRHLTTWPAHAAFDEDRLGALAPGMLADLVVLSGDPLAVPADALRALAVDMTVFDGRVVFERGAAPGRGRDAPR